ncbi:MULTISPECIES: zinc-ribbon domain-containing protein [Pseudomonas]|uniref:Zinc-ribbon domain-containing protein n=1 Tax=Pseudomonas spirodelae TaxID=3101751 RepID=A0ABU5P3R1_9PSED|nr:MULTISPECIES: zinc ribbon domain-containing protein [unclassified Pseudomonas]MDD2161320.1 zinc-ribbon domain-containing protein [Pseudomonas sp. MIL19]MEA1604282.1 zinc-ribbon domain-containing protein [Pseudomonas sp. T5W1]
MSGECKSCGAQVSNDAKTCPSCGASLTAKTKLLPLAAFMLIVILIIQSYISKPDDAERDAKPAAPVSSAAQ